MNIDDLDEKVEVLVSQGDLLEAIAVLEEGINLRKQTLGSDSSQLEASYAILCDMCNSAASEYLQREDFALSLSILRKAQSLAKNNPQGMVKTLNNMSAYYKRTGNLRTAHKCLLKALEIDSDAPSTHLNMCAVFSQQENHFEAVTSAMQAVILLQQKLMTDTIPEGCIEMLVIAYHNTAVELEYSKRSVEALNMYQKAQSFAIENLGTEHSLSVSAINAAQAFMSKPKGKQKKSKAKNPQKADNVIERARNVMNKEEIIN